MVERLADEACFAPMVDGHLALGYATSMLIPMACLRFSWWGGIPLEVLCALASDDLANLVKNKKAIEHLRYDKC